MKIFNHLHCIHSKMSHVGRVIAALIEHQIGPGNVC